MANVLKITAENKSMDDSPKYDFEFRVRLPKSLADKIEATANKEHRSKNMQYVYMLENWFEINDGIEKRIENLENLLSENTVYSQKTKKKVV